MLSKICQNCIPEYDNDEGFGEPIHSIECLNKKTESLKEENATFRIDLEAQLERNDDLELENTKLKAELEGLKHDINNGRIY